MMSPNFHRLSMAVAAVLGWNSTVQATDPLTPQIPLIMPNSGSKTVAIKQPAKPGDADKVTVWKRWMPTGQPMELGQCLEIGQANQPTVKAAKASLASGERGYLSLQNFSRALELLSPDLPVRRLQAQKGIVAATAEVVRAQQEVIYDVARMYFTYVYATQQEQTANEIVEQMETFYRVAEEILKAGVVDPENQNQQLHAVRPRRRHRRNPPAAGQSHARAQTIARRAQRSDGRRSVVPHRPVDSGTPADGRERDPRRSHG